MFLKTMWKQSVLAAVALLVLSVQPAIVRQASAQQAEPKRAITQIAGDLYRFQNNFHFSVFYVTGEGIIATDPINADAAKWLKAELAKRFPGRAVKYLVYSHDHADHISGGEVFADTAIVIAHENAREPIIGEKRATAVPTVTFTDRMTLRLGGKTVELIYPGRNHSNNSLVLLFPAERTVFAVDFIPVKNLPFRDLPDSYFPDWMDSLTAVERLDFDILAPGHGAMGTKADVALFRGYMNDLYAAVQAGVRAGKSVDELKQTVMLEKYKDWGQYQDYRPLNIEGMYRYVSANRRPN